MVAVFALRSVLNAKFIELFRYRSIYVFLCFVCVPSRYYRLCATQRNYKSKKIVFFILPRLLLAYTIRTQNQIGRFARLSRAFEWNRQLAEVNTESHHTNKKKITIINYRWERELFFFCYCDRLKAASLTQRFQLLVDVHSYFSISPSKLYFDLNYRL